jgi:hypothetical protein
MKHTIALAPYVVLMLAALFVVLVMAAENACAPAAPTQRIARKHRPDYLGQAILDSQNYHAAKR